METPARVRPEALEDTGFANKDGVLINDRIYVCVGLYKGPKHDYLVVKDESGNKFKAFLNTCQKIDGPILETVTP